MKQSVISRILTDHEVRRLVVVWIFVHMVNLRTNRQRLTKSAFRDSYVLIHVARIRAVRLHVRALRRECGFQRVRAPHAVLLLATSHEQLSALSAVE